MNTWNTENFTGSQIICMMIQWWLHVIMHLSKPKECTPKVNPNANYGLWVIMMCQNVGPLIAVNEPLCSRCQQWGGCACLGHRVFGNSAISAQFCCEPKTNLQNKS